MKTFLYTTRYVAAILTACLCIFACGKNEVEEPEPGPGPVPPDNNTGELKEQCMVIKSITCRTRYPNGSYVTDELSNFNYETEPYSQKTVLTSYKDNRYKYSLPEEVINSSGSSNTEYQFAAIGRTRIASYKSGWTVGKYDYDSAGRLITITETEFSDIAKRTYTYDNTYNIIRYERTFNGRRTDAATIHYTSIKAKCAPLQILTEKSVFSLTSYTEPWAFFDAGLFENSLPLYLIDKIVHDNGTEFQYKYTTNQEGYVTQMEEYKYLTDGVYISTYDIVWEPVNNGSVTYSYWLYKDIGSPYYRYLN